MNRLKHGHWNSGKLTPTYRSWLSMRRRCNNSNYVYTHRYKERGITYDISWNDFNSFLQDMGIRPENTTLDRIDNSRGYFKDNCRWATPLEQGQNRDLPKQYSTNKSGYTGIHWDKERKKWFVQIRRNNKTIALGRFDSLEEAVHVRESRIVTGFAKK